jgi:hypothetical protein
MNLNATEFTRMGDEVFNQFATCFPSARRWRLLLEQPLASADFAAVRGALLAYLGSVLGSGASLTEQGAIEQLLQRRGELPNYTRGGMLAPAREHTLEFNLLHRSVAQALSRFLSPKLVDGVDLPINVRLVYGATDTSQTTAPFSSSKLHSDVWAGVPADAVVVVLPLLGDIDNLTIECCEMPPERELELMRPYEAYELPGSQVEVKHRYSDAVMKHGHFYLADVRLLHRTLRRKPEGARVSIDFRLRYNALTYRQLIPSAPHHGPDSADTRVPYPQWQQVGHQSLVVFDHYTSSQDAQRASSSPVNTASYRLLNLW